MATATRSRPRAAGSAGARRAELRAALERALTAVAADERRAAVITATRLRMRFEFTDLDLALNVSAAEGDGEITWSFADEPGWTPKLVLRMTSEVANRYLQGRESLAIGIARGQVSCTADSRVALLYLPAARLLCEPYRRVIEADYPDLVAA